MLAPIAIGFRALQLLMGAAVVGLSVTLMKGQVIGPTPTTTRYSVFTGAFAMIVAFLGVVCLFISAVPDIFSLALDAVAGLLLLAGGIAWAVGLQGVNNCNPQTAAQAQKMVDNPLLNEGTVGSGKDKLYGFSKHNGNSEDVNLLLTRCKYALSDEIVQFILFALCGVLLFVGYLIMRRGKGGGKVRY